MEVIIPTEGEREEALLFPKGWVYRIHTLFINEENVPAKAIIGAWKVDSNGQIIGNFVHNPNFSEEFCANYFTRL